MMLNSIRIRLTLWYLLATGVLLISFCLFSCILLSRSLYRRLDDSLSLFSSTKTAVLIDELREEILLSSATAGEMIRENSARGFFEALVLGNDVIATDLPEDQLNAITTVLARSSPNEKSQYLFTVPEFGEEGARVAVSSFKIKGQRYRVLSIKPMDDVVEQLEAVRHVYYLCVPLALVLTALGGYSLAKKSLHPVVRMSEQARNIGATTLHERLIVKNENDELGKLAVVFNEMLERIDGAFKSMSAFITDASHEMRTPVAIIQGESEIALSRQRTVAEHEESLSIIHDESRRLSSMVNDLLTLSRADAGQRRISITEFYMNDLLEECYRAIKALAAKKNIVVSIENTDDAPMSGDEYLLKQLIMNLLDNAIRYTQANGTVSLSLACGKDKVKVIVADDGIGMNPEESKRIFERFYRVDKVRSRSDGGSGLGLAIADFIVKAHGGSIDLKSRPGQGSAFTVNLPRFSDYADASRQNSEDIYHT